MGGNTPLGWSLRKKNLVRNKVMKGRIESLPGPSHHCASSELGGGTTSNSIRNSKTVEGLQRARTITIWKHRLGD